MIPWNTSAISLHQTIRMKGTCLVCLKKANCKQCCRSPANKAKHLNRVAAEYTQLLYHASKARMEKCAFIDEIQWVCETFPPKNHLLSSVDLLENRQNTVNSVLRSRRPLCLDTFCNSRRGQNIRLREEQNYTRSHRVPSNVRRSRSVEGCRRDSSYRGHALFHQEGMSHVSACRQMEVYSLP